MGYSGAGEKLIHEKNQKQKISWHCPFKQIVVSDPYVFAPPRSGSVIICPDPDPSIIKQK